MAKRMASQPPGKPLSVLEITKRAEDFEYNPHVPLRYWLRTADTLLKEASDLTMSSHVLSCPVMSCHVKLTNPLPGSNLRARRE